MLKDGRLRIKNGLYMFCAQFDQVCQLPLPNVAADTPFDIPKRLPGEGSVADRAARFRLVRAMTARRRPRECAPTRVRARPGPAHF